MNVVNYTSDEHEWFQKSRKRISPYSNYYIWRPEGPNRYRDVQTIYNYHRSNLEKSPEAQLHKM